MTNNHSNQDDDLRLSLKRRALLGSVAAAATLGTTYAADAAAPIKIAAVVPLAGAFAASGQDMLAGAKLAAADINAAGGIKSIGGRHIEIVPADAGESPEAAVTAARRALNGQTVAALGSWYSALSLADTVVAEQKKIPWLTGSIADKIVQRGFKYVHQISAGSAASGQGLIDSIVRAGGGKDMRLALITDNNVANVEVKKYIRGKLSAKPVSDQTWTPPLADATPVVSAVMQANPNVIYLGATSTSDQTLVIKQLAAQGSKALILLGASSGANPVFLKTVGAKGMEGVLVVTGVSFPGKGSAAIDKRYASATGRTFMDCEAMTGYMNVTIIARGLEKAAKADPKALNAALKTLDLVNDPVLSLLPNGNHFKFEPDGHRAGTAVELVQWQNGRPLVVYPPDVANGTLKHKA